MKHRSRIVFFTIILAIVLIVNTSCRTSYVNTEFVPDFSQERMLDIIETMSAEDGGRIAGFDGEAQTAEYIIGKYNEIGLSVSRQSFPVKAFTCKSVSFVNNLSQEVLIDVKALSFSAPTPAEGITAEVIPVGMGTESDFEEIDVKGKIALIRRGGEYFRDKTQRAADHGAVAAVFYDPNGEEALAATLTYLSAIPAISISRKKAEAMEKSVSGGNKVEAKIIVDSIYRDSLSENVIGVYKSTNNPEGKYVVVGAHYDGVDTPAANDNASGVAVLIEMAAALKEQKIRLPYDVAFIAFGAEEIGLLGSSAYVGKMSRTDLGKIIAMINFDMVGVGEYFDLYTADGTDATGLQKSMIAVLERMGHTPAISKTERSDHTPFSYSGIQAVDVQMSPPGHYHTDFDNIDAIQPELLEKVCEFGIRVLTEELVTWVE